ncbi:hypothetical protein BGZ83_006941 [Gryganskiella cystojenkinii]|nr:hypothetical protein BGZ83_006941 [Gryganskiella cystojenkinii]
MSRRASEDSHPRRDHLEQDSDCTSDSNEEFASASEGDDDLPWEPVVIRSPVIARSSLVLPQPQQTGPEVDRDGPTPTPSSQATHHHHHHHHLQQHRHQQQEHHDHVQEQQQHQYHQSHQQEQQAMHQTARTPPQHWHDQHQQRDHRESSSSLHVQQYQHQQSQSRTELHSQSQHQPRQFPSHSTFASSEGQISPSQTASRSAPPKLRERMRHSPVPHSRIVKAYLDPYTTGPQQQHSTETIRQAWLQDQRDTSSQESSEDEVDQQHLPVTQPLRFQHTQSHTPSHRTPTQLPRTTQPAYTTAPPVLHQVQHQQKQDMTPPRTRPFSPPTAPQTSVAASIVEPDIRPKEQSTTAVQLAGSDGEEAAAGWGFDDGFDELSPIEHDGSQVQSSTSVPLEVTESNSYETQPHHTQSLVDEPPATEEAEGSWGFDDDIVVKEPVQDLPPAVSSETVSYAQEQEQEHDCPHTHAVHEDATEDIVEDAWGYDDQNLELATEPHNLDNDDHHHTQESNLSSQPPNQHPLQPETESYPHMHSVHEDNNEEGEDAWGHDENVDIDIEGAPADYETFNLGTPDVPAQRQNVGTTGEEETSWGFDETATDNAVAGEEASWEFDGAVPQNSLPEEPVAQVDVTSNMNEESRQWQDNMSSDFQVHTAQEPTESHVDHSSVNTTLHEHSIMTSTEPSTIPSTVPESAIAQEHAHVTTEAIIDFGDFEQDGWGYDDDAVIKDTQSVHEEQYQHDEGDDLSTTEQVIAEEGSRESRPENTAESDNEHDTEVQQVLGSNSAKDAFSGSEEVNLSVESSEASVLSDAGNDNLTSESMSRVSEVNIPTLADLPPLLMRDHLPVFIDGSSRDTPLDQSEVESLADSTGSNHQGFDSEGSDIYGDLSTARAGMNASSNRLNEILEDDDYLEHMERGVPMNRSISTPYSDEEVPKFIVEDDLAELMERGEPRPVGGALSSRPVSSDLESDAETDQVDLEVTASVDGLAGSSEPTTALGVDVQLSDRYDTAVAPTDEVVIVQESSSDVSIHEPLTEPLSLAVEISDDQDPENPFSDAAALDDQRSWPDEEHQRRPDQLEVQQDEESVHEASSPSVEHHRRQLDAVDVEDDAWDDQDVGIAVEPLVTKINTQDSVVSDYHEDNSLGRQRAVSTSSSSSLKIGSIIRHPTPTEQQEEAVENAWGWDEDQVEVHLEIQKETPPSIHDGSMVSTEANTTNASEQESPEAKSPAIAAAAVALDPIDLLFEQLEGRSEPTIEQPAPSTSLTEASATKAFDVDDFFKEISEPSLVTSPLVHPVEHEIISGTTLDQPLEELHADRVHGRHEDNLKTGSILQAEVVAEEEEDQRMDAWGDATPLDLPAQDNALHVGQVKQIVATGHDTLEEFDFYQHDQGYRSAPATADHEALEELDILQQNQTTHEEWSDHVATDYGDSTNIEVDIEDLEADPWDTEEPVIPLEIASEHPQLVPSKPCPPDDILEPQVESVHQVSETDPWDEQLDITVQEDIPEPAVQAVVGDVEVEIAPAVDSTLAQKVQETVQEEPNVAVESDSWDEPWDEPVETLGQRPSSAAVEGITASETLIQDHEPPSVASVVPVDSQEIIVDSRDAAWGFDEDLSDVPEHRFEEFPVEETFAARAVDTATASMSPHDRLFSDTIHHLPPVTGGLPQFSSKVKPAAPAAPSQPTSSIAILAPASPSLNFQESSRVDEDEQDAWGGDDQVMGQDADQDAWGDDSQVVEDHAVERHIESAAAADSEQEAWDDDNQVLDNHSERLQEQEIEEDAWDGDNRVLEDLVAQTKSATVGLIEVEEPVEAVIHPVVPAQVEPLEDLPEIDTEDNGWGFDEHVDQTPETETLSVATALPVSPSHAHADLRTPSPSATGGLSPLTIRKDRRLAPVSASGCCVDSSESNDDTSSHSPWQDISPASVSKRSEAGMSIGSEFESEYSVRSLGDDEGSLTASATHTHAVSENRVSSSDEERDVSKKDGMTSAMSWTDLNHEDDWQDHPIAIESESQHYHPQHQQEELSQHSKEISLESTSSKEVESSGHSTTELVDLPDIGGADSWDYDHDEEDDLDIRSRTTTTSSSATSHAADQIVDTTATTASQLAMSIPRESLKTPDMSERRPFSGGLQHKSSFTGSNFTSVSSPGGRTNLSSYPSSLAGSVPPSPGTQQTLAPSSPVSTSGAAPNAVEVEDDSHLPLAIRQQRARLAAKGKPLPPISKYKSTKTESSTTESTRGQTVTSPSPRLSAAGVVSPTISFSSPINITAGSSSAASVSQGSGAIFLVPDQKYLSPALLKQKERLEQKRAAAAAASKKVASAVPLKPAVAPASPKAANAAVIPLSSSLSSSSSLKSSTALPLVTESIKPQVASSTSSLSPVEATELGQASRRRGASGTTTTSTTSSTTTTTSTFTISNKIKAPTPSSPLSEGFVRRSKDGHRPTGLWSQDEDDNVQSDEGVVRTSQSDVTRHGLSNKRTSMTASGWDHSQDEEDVKEQQQSAFSATGKNASVSNAFESKPSLFSPKTPLSATLSAATTSSSSSFYQQSVPGLDGDDDDDLHRRPEFKSSSSYLGRSSVDKDSKKKDHEKEEFDSYGPAASRQQHLSPLKTKSKNSFEDDRQGSSSSFGESSAPAEILMGSTISAPSGVSLMSPTLGGSFSMSYRHDHHRRNSGTGGGSLVGDISSILKEKKNPTTEPDNSSSRFNAGDNNNYADNDSKGKSIAASSSPSSAQQASRPPPPIQKSSSSSWSFGSLLSSAVAVATETIDKAYESLDPEYSRMKSRGGSGSPSMNFSEDGIGAEGSQSPFKKPGYVVGGSSLALGLASITTTKSPPPTLPDAQQQQPQQPQQPQQSKSKPSFESFSRPAVRRVSEEEELSSSSTPMPEHHHQHHHHASASSAALSPRMTRKHVDRRD